MADNLRELLQSKQQLIRDMSHELRTPLTRIRMGIELATAQATATPASEQLDAEQTIKQVRTVHTEGELGIDAHLKVSTLEDLFWERFGLNVQVFRLSGNLWLQTSSTDQWSLAEQNRKGGHSAQAYREMHGDSTNFEEIDQS